MDRDGHLDFNEWRACVASIMQENRKEKEIVEQGLLSNMYAMATADRDPLDDGGHGAPLENEM